MKRRQRTCWKKSVAVWTVLFFSQYAGLALAAEDTFKYEIPTLKMDLQLILPDTIVLNEPFPITFNVTVNDSVRHFNDTPDEITIALPPVCKVVDGDPVWRGMLSRGSRVTLNITAKFTQPGTESFGGYVRTGSFSRGYAADGTHPARTEESYTTKTRVSSRVFAVTGPRPDSVQVDSRGRKLIVRDTYEEHPTAKNREASEPKYNQITVAIRGRSPEYLGEYLYYRNRRNQVSFTVEDKATGTKRRALPKTWSFDCGNCYMKLYPDSTARITIDEARDSVTLQVEINGATYKVSFRVRATTSITGTFRYVDNLGDTVAGYGTYAELYGWENDQWRLSDSAIIPTDGHFAFTTDCDYVRLEFWSFNYHCRVPYSTGCWDLGDPWLYYVRQLDFTISEPGTVYEIDPYYTTIVNLDWAGAFNICKYLQIGADYVEQCCGDPGLLLVRWGRHCDEDTRYDRDTLWVNVDDQLTMTFMLTVGSKGCGSENWDEWDPNQILYEYGHHFTNIFAEFPDSCAASHSYLCPTDPLDPFVIPEHLAWNEAFANWFQGCVLRTDYFIDYDKDNDLTCRYHFETPSPDAPYCSTLVFGLQADPSSVTPLWPGSRVEGAITEALWDMYDAPNDTNFWLSGNIWGHNNDQNQNDSWRGDAAILDVYMNYDPFPNDPHHNHPWDISEFANGWGVRGYPVTGHFQDILLAHAIDICNSCGDANGSGNINIADAVFLIAYIFAGGTTPHCQ